MDSYRTATPRSARAFERGGDVIAGGISRQTLRFAPYPLYTVSGQGSHVVDVDGNRYLDLVNNFTSLVHGHAHPPTVEAMVRSAQRGHVLGCGSPDEHRLAVELRRRFPVMELMRFATTGSEATVLAARAARAVTGRQRVVKFEGGFHGSGDEFLVSIQSAPLEEGAFGSAEPQGAGLRDAGTLVARYNDLASVAGVFAAYGDEIAAVVVEPFLGNAGLIAAEPGFLQGVADVARAHGALFVLDEIQSTRLAVGGAQSLHGVRPDLMTTGKIIGGGLPLAAMGGRADVMAEAFTAAVPVNQTGTFTAFAMALEAGWATLDCLREDDVSRLGQLGAAVRAGMADVLSERSVVASVGGQGSMFSVTFTEDVPRHTSELHGIDTSRWGSIHQELLARRVYTMHRGSGCLSTAVTDDDVADFLTAFDEAVAAALGAQAAGWPGPERGND